VTYSPDNHRVIGKNMSEKEKKPKSKGTVMAVMAESTRAASNHLDDEKRHQLMGKALARIYKGGHGKVATRCR